MYEEEVEQIIKNTRPSSSLSDRQYPTWVVIVLVVVALAGLAGLGFLIYKLVKVVKNPPKQENYQHLHRILTKNCNLSLPDYIAILDNTTNTQSISLQELCQNFTCNVEDQEDREKVLKMITTVAKPEIVKCLKNEDWLRLALINLKIYDIMNIFDKSFIAERALTNGVYGVEYINIPKQNLIEIIKYTQTNLNEKTAKEFSKKNGFTKEDEESLLEYTKFVNNFLKEGESILTEVMSCDNTNPFIFALITTVSIGNMVFKSKSGC